MSTEARSYALGDTREHYNYSSYIFLWLINSGSFLSECVFNVNIIIDAILEIFLGEPWCIELHDNIGSALRYYQLSTLTIKATIPIRITCISTKYNYQKINKTLVWIKRNSKSMLNSSIKFIHIISNWTRPFETGVGISMLWWKWSDLENWVSAFLLSV